MGKNLDDPTYSVEISGIWKRTKKYLNLNEIKSGSLSSQKEELKQIMLAKDTDPKGTMQGHMGFLVKKNFVEAALNNNSIRQELNEYAASAYRQRIEQKGQVKQEKEITVKKGRLKEYEGVQFRGIPKGAKTKRQVILGTIYFKKRGD